MYPPQHVLMLPPFGNRLATFAPVWSDAVPPLSTATLTKNRRAQITFISFSEFDLTWWQLVGASNRYGLLQGTKCFYREFYCWVKMLWANTRVFCIQWNQTTWEQQFSKCCEMHFGQQSTHTFWRMSCDLLTYSLTRTGVILCRHFCCCNLFQFMNSILLFDCNM